MHPQQFYKMRVWTPMDTPEIYNLKVGLPSQGYKTFRHSVYKMPRIEVTSKCLIAGFLNMFAAVELVFKL